jgi:hypothetical protein
VVSNALRLRGFKPSEAGGPASASDTVAASAPATVARRLEQAPRWAVFGSVGLASLVVGFLVMLGAISLLRPRPASRVPADQASVAAGDHVAQAASLPAHAAGEAGVAAAAQPAAPQDLPAADGARLLQRLDALAARLDELTARLERIEQDLANRAGDASARGETPATPGVAGSGSRAGGLESNLSGTLGSVAPLTSVARPQTAPPTPTLRILPGGP